MIRDSIVGLGTDEDSLSRAIVTRAEVDLLKVRFEYYNMFKTNLDDDVTGDTSGDYKDFLMTLLGRGPEGEWYFITTNKHLSYNRIILWLIVWF